MTTVLTEVASHDKAAVRVVGVTKKYGKGEAQVVALNDVSIDFPKGHFTAIMGPSGSGKSTLMHVAAGLDDFDSGEIFVSNINITGMKERHLTLLRRENVGFVFQSFNLIPTLTAKENITLPLDLAGKKPDGAWFDQVIHTVHLEDRLTHRPSELSGGQQQRVAVARALVSRPEIIFADEPTGNLDSKSGTEVLTFLRKAVTELHQTIVMVTHDANAASYADRVVFLNDGKIVDEMHSPTAESILDRLKTLGA